MKREISYADLEKALVLLTKIATKEVTPRWEIAKRKRVIRVAMEPVEEAREVPEDVQEYQKKRYDVYRKYGSVVDGAVQVPKEDVGALDGDIADLEAEYASVIEQEAKRQKDIADLMKKKVEVDIDPIAYEWIGDFLDSNGVEVLMEIEMVDDPVEEEEDEEVSKERSRKARNQKKRAKKK